jgi:molecular chaperone DnaK (HSP70)
MRPRMAEPRFLVGIDLGTTNTVVAYADLHAAGDGERPTIRAFDVDQLVAPGEIASRPLLPSARYQPGPGELPDGETRLPWSDAIDPEDRDADGVRHVVGQLALDLGSKVPGRLVASAKSWLCHPAVDRTAAILPWGAPPEITKISPVEASASYLRHLAGAWVARFPKHPLGAQEVVLTIPASFDESARALTLAASRDAAIPRPRLVEEPQAAFYDWLDRHAAQGELARALADVRLAIVVDVGGGTTDFSLLKIELRAEGPRLTRIAVGDHLMLGGDNMDLAIAKRVEARIGGGSPLGAARFSQLVAQCRLAKEKLLGADAPEHVRVTVLGSGSKLVGGARSADVSREEVRDLVVDGFFPAIRADARPERRRGAIVEFGLPYVADAAVTKHVAAFLSTHDALAREALGDRAPAPGTLAVPDAILFNGGVFHGVALEQRVRDVVGTWRGAPLAVLENPHPDLAVARGAVAYALARRGVGLRITAGSARSYFLRVEDRGVCLLPRGAEEGEEIVLSARTFSLKLGRPVRFSLVTSASDVRHVAPGDLVDVDGDMFDALPPLAAVLEGSDAEKGKELPVKVAAALTEIGTLEMSCIAADDEKRRWKLELLLRGGSDGGEGGTTHVTTLHPRFAQAVEKVRRIYGKSSDETDPREVKTLRAELEKILGDRAEWDTPLLRELFGALLAGVKRRRRSADHERVWLNLAGFALRPGYGYPLDDWRARQIAPLVKETVQFAPEAQNWAELWIFWRRIAGGLDARSQEELASQLEHYLHPPTERPRPRPAGPKMLGYDDMVRLAGALEHLSPERKATLGGWLVERLVRHPAAKENAQSWAAVGRIGARVPFYGSAHNVVRRDVALGWLAETLRLDWTKHEHAPFAATLLARVSGDRERDLDASIRDPVAARLDAIGAPESWRRMVREVTHLDAADERRVFGESLPPGLRLLD